MPRTELWVVLAVAVLAVAGWSRPSEKYEDLTVTKLLGEFALYKRYFRTL